jgi:dihydrodipicolinate synthase/N-acetylneuraminate lyase
LNAKEARGYLLAVADRSELPVVLAGELPVELVAELAGHPRVLGLVSDFARPEEIRLLVEKTAAVKRSVTVTQVFAAVTRRMRVADTPEGALVSAESLTGGVAVLAAVASKPAVKTRTKVVGFQILAAGTERMLEGLAAGVVGVVPAFGASAPQACYEVVAAWKDGDPGLAEEKQLRLVEAVRRVEGELGVAGIKYGCDLNGYFGGTPRLPLLRITGEQRVEIEALMQGLRS